MANHAEQQAFLSLLRREVARGVPYQWGGTNLARGVDCSGLVYRAAQLAGIKNVPRTSEEQFKVGTPVQMNGLRPGDLVFFHYDGAPGDASHVAIYAGGGRVIEAAHTGTDVKYTPLSAFAGHILGARRILANPAGQVQNSAGFAQQQKQYFLQQGGQVNPAVGFQANANLMAQLRANAPQLQSAQQTLQQLNQRLQPQTPSLQSPLQPAQTQAPVGDLNTLHSQLLRAPNPLQPRLPVSKLA